MMCGRRTGCLRLHGSRSIPSTRAVCSRRRVQRTHRSIRTVVGLAIPRMPSSAAARRMIAAQRQAAHNTDLGDQTIQQIAADTGGKAFVNTNGFQDAIQTGPRRRGQLLHHRLHAAGQGRRQFPQHQGNVNGGYQLAYRDGYYADRHRRRRRQLAPAR